MRLYILERGKGNFKLVLKKLSTEDELSVAAERLVRSIGSLVTKYPSVIQELEEGIYYFDHPDTTQVVIHASASGPLDVDAAMAARQKPWTVPELAKLLNLSQRGLYDHVKKGRLSSYKIGTAIRLCPATTQTWFRNCISHPARLR
jgi:excisionase family DNA binding protein